MQNKQTPIAVSPTLTLLSNRPSKFYRRHHRTHDADTVFSFFLKIRPLHLHIPISNYSDFLSHTQPQSQPHLSTNHRTLNLNHTSSLASRNGTPRQPLLVPLARSRLDLPPGAVPPAALEGLGGYSHCWLLYLFHANTDLQRLWQPDPFRGLRAKVKAFMT